MQTKHLRNSDNITMLTNHVHSSDNNTDKADSGVLYNANKPTTGFQSPFFVFVETMARLEFNRID